MILFKNGLRLAYEVVSESDLGLRQSEGVILGKGRTIQVVKRLLTLLMHIIPDATFRKMVMIGPVLKMTLQGHFVTLPVGGSQPPAM